MKKRSKRNSVSLHGMADQDWEALCCRCGICCLHRFRDQKTGKVRFTAIACRHLNPETCRCTVYEHRFETERDCNKVTPENVLELNWLPKTCGYRTVAEGRDLEWWHPLVSGDPETVHEAGISLRNKGVISEQDVIAGDILRYLVLHGPLF
jgi:hypothetical protein